MGRRPQLCAVCGNASQGRKFCTDACKMRDYRKRKQAQKEAERQTIDMESWTIQHRLVMEYGEQFDLSLGNFFISYGKEAYCQMLALFQQALGVIHHVEYGD